MMDVKHFAKSPAVPRRKMMLLGKKVSGVSKAEREAAFVECVGGDPDYDANDPLELFWESKAAAASGACWQDRGPPPSACETWRGQRWREGVNGGRARGGNRGGSKTKGYAQYYAALKAGVTGEALRRCHPKFQDQ
jgi:hypothetical protein